MGREEKKIATRKRILQVALELFNEQGYEATSVALIAERAGIGKGTFFNYFKTKEDLILDIGDAQVSWALPHIELLMAEQGPVIPGLMNLMQAMGSRVNSFPGIIRAIAQANYANPDRGAVETSRAMELGSALIPLITKGQETGELTRRLAPSMIAVLILQTYFGVLQSWSLAPHMAGLSERLKVSMEALFYGVAGKGTERGGEPVAGTSCPLKRIGGAENERG